MRSAGRRQQARQAEGPPAPQAASEHAPSTDLSRTAQADSPPAVGTAAEPSASFSDHGPAQHGGAALQRPRQVEAKLGAAGSSRARMAEKAVPLSKEEAAQQVWGLHGRRTAACGAALLHTHVHCAGAAVCCIFSGAINGPCLDKRAASAVHG